MRYSRNGRWRRYKQSRKLLRLGLYSGLLATPLLVGVVPVTWAHDQHTLTIMSTVLEGAIHGRFNGSYQGHPNQAVFDDLVPGDIIFCHDAGGGYGYYTHCALYVGNGKVVESANFREGTQVIPVESFHGYDEVRVKRVLCSYPLRLRAAHYALAQVDRGYSIFGGLHDHNSMYCSKLVWSAFDAQGVQLCAQSRWIIPDDLSVSPKLQEVKTSSLGK
ncbi:YiiX/YebB-like N1pC/P60 family cysteine hydrolase [Alicyclobacillus fastidiosus]|uniref:YiiX/YebB-like N1pC/P60 family cysteine hydrolase n=1 Tax=Alicyclobacillus fastidiosus TaxID=392011 RepID=A0ABY6ZNM0_9BACL|nr:YiiX/YebB-like N1pC/P60 family cysteine hydrolase [Alicyclobacillus fastidiosus]WAH44439.1 YiiX/YebB-like N1pC/P60 family cysteine hydrolase [Alicyclobacillus fastidiosus]